MELDPSYTVAYSSISSEHDGMLYYDKDHRQIPLIEVEEPYKPAYDAETANIQHRFFKHETTLYRDCYIEIATFRSRNLFDRLLKLKLYMVFDKYVGRHLGLGKDTQEETTHGN